MMTLDASEREVYRAAIHGDRDAFEMIIRTHNRQLFAIAYGILQNRSLNALGKVENVSVQRQNRDDVDLANAPADLSIQVYSQGNIVARESGIFATLRRTIAQSAVAIMWSLRTIGVAIAFLAPWVVAIIGLVWIVKRIKRARSK